MEIAGYVASLFIGISLGLIGGGGSIITVPVLVYLFGINAQLATYYSLFVVGITSLVGTWPKYFKGYVHLKTAWIFGIPSIIAVIITRRLILPLIPETIFSIGEFVLTKSILMMVLFAILMVVASVAMIKSSSKEMLPTGKKSAFALMSRGFMVGTITGFVGVGGGFLIIPSLVVLLGFSMKDAIGTSLFIIAINSLLGFLGDLQKHTIPWQLLISITALSILGMFIGNILSNKISGEKLKKGFGWFILIMGVYILMREIFLK